MGRGCSRHRIRRDRSSSGSEGSNSSDFGIVLGTRDVAAVDDRTRQGVGVLLFGGGNDTWDHEVTATIDGIEDGGEGGAKRRRKCCSSSFSVDVGCDRGT